MVSTKCILSVKVVVSARSIVSVKVVVSAKRVALDTARRAAF